MKRLNFFSRCAVMIFAALTLTACQTTGAPQTVPSCDELRASIEDRPHPDLIGLAYPDSDAIYVGRGPEAVALVRNGGRCRVEGKHDQQQ